MLATLMMPFGEGSPLYFRPSQNAVLISSIRDLIMRESIQRRQSRSVQEEEEADPDEPVEDLVLDYVLAEPKLIGPLDEKTTFEKYMRGTNAPYMRFGKRSDPANEELNQLVHDLVGNLKRNPKFAAHKQRHFNYRSLTRMNPNFLLVPLDF
ncbi:hypothetical protein AAVH_14968 [Aphelenchoides avenae]|nr:hypothetical protein AAVH_14968 [Aphelenchus avenae]